MNNRTIALKKIRELNISAPATSGRPLHLSAASGLVCLGKTMYVIADDELHIGKFPVDGSEPGRLIRLFDGVLPEAKAARKLEKPDLEALVFLPPLLGFPCGALLAIGSGSRANRRRGALVELDYCGGISGSPRAIDLSAFLSPLEEEFSEINIEGAVVVGEEFFLFQRGNGEQADNAIVRYPLRPLLEALESASIDRIKPSSVDRFDLGSINGVPFGFTDAAAMPDGKVVFCAVAENTQDTFRDGPCVGAAIGVLERNGRLRFWHQLDQPYKVEGIHARLKDQRIELLLVTDPDDPHVAATLLAGSMVA